MEARPPARDSKMNFSMALVKGGAGEPTRYFSLTEQGLEVFKRTQKSSRKEAHAKDAIDVAGVFPMVGPSSPWNKKTSQQAENGRD